MEPVMLHATSFVIPLAAIACVAIGWLIARRFKPQVTAFVGQDSWMRSILLFVLAMNVGVSLISILEQHGGSFRFWYWLAIFPWLCVMAAAFGAWVPRRAWRWGVAPLLGQWLWEVAVHGDQIGIGNLGPFAHLVVFGQYALTAIPCVIAAEVAASWSRTRSASAAR
jgi:hypothetical protein